RHPVGGRCRFHDGGSRCAWLTRSRLGYGGYPTSRSHRDDAAIVRPAVGEADRELAIVREHAAGADESVRAEDGVVVHERGAHGERIAVSVDAAATHDLAGIRPDDPIGPDAGGGLARRV